MKAESMIAVRAGSNRETILAGAILLAAVAMLWLAPAAVQGADPGGSKAGANPVVTLEKIPGSAIPRVTLSAKAAERLGIETGKVGEELIARKQMVSGLVIPPMDKAPESKPTGGGFGGYGRVPPAAEPKPAGGGFGGNGRIKTALAPQPVVPAPVAAPVTTLPAGEVWVLVTLSPGEYERLAKDKPARLLPLATRADSGTLLMAQPSGMTPVDDVKRTMMSLYYKVPGKDHGLAINNRMRVELPLTGSEEKQKAVPYSAVYYDAKGAAWVYVSTKPLTYERQPIAVDRVIGDMAVLSQGPAVGTPVVTVGAALLYGTEIFKK